MQIVIATHKKKSVLESKIFRPIQVNAENSSFIIDSSYLKDNLGNNISSKNLNYSELTALYYLWKNVDSDIVGLMHYRRIFNFLQPRYIKPHRERNIFPDAPILGKLKMERTERLVRSYLKRYDVILPYFRKHVNVSVAEGYIEAHVESDWNTCMEIIKEKYPSYTDSIRTFLYDSNIIYGRNMFVSSKSWLEEYATWLFDILFELEERISISQDAYQKRVFGFLSERLLTLYVRHNEFKIKHFQYLFLEE